jgi:hypothetical protein
MEHVPDETHLDAGEEEHLDEEEGVQEELGDEGGLGEEREAVVEGGGAEGDGEADAPRCDEPVEGGYG